MSNVRPIFVRYLLLCLIISVTAFAAFNVEMKTEICPPVTCAKEIETETQREAKTSPHPTQGRKKEEVTTQRNEMSYDLRRDIAQELLEISIQLQGAGESIRSDTKLKLNGVIARLDPRYSLSLLDVNTHNGSLYDEADTCNEKYIGRKKGYPYYQKGFRVSPDCPASKRERPISELVSVLILNTRGKYLHSVVEGIRNYSRDMTIFVATSNSSDLTYRFNNTKMILVTEHLLEYPGTVINSLYEHVETPYILIAKDLTHFTNYSRVERLVYLLPRSSPVGVAAGTTRNLTGHWNQCCQQTDIKNYLLRITQGYLHSTQDCMFCDYISGPFLVKRDILETFRFDESLHSQVAFHDWFYKLKEGGVLAVICPDVMFFIHGQNEPLREHWLMLAKSLQTSQIFISPNTHFKFSCSELSLTCDPWSWTEFYLLPTCCFEQVANALKQLDQFANASNLAYELDSGSQLAAVKLQGHSPWDLDGDIQYNATFSKLFKEYAGIKSNSGIYFSEFRTSTEFKIFTPEIYIEMWGMNDLSTSLFLPEDLKQTPTLMKVLGVWVRGQSNPGLYARNKYGPNHLKHALFYLFNNHSEWSQYKTAGKWPSCPKNSHACVNRYPADGSVYFVPHYFDNLGISWR